MKHRRPRYGALIFAVICFVNPFFNAFDFLPDFIGAFIIASLLSRGAEVVPYLAEARDGFYKYALTSLIRLPAAVIMFSNLHTGMDIVPLFTLTFTVIELIFLYPAVINAARGLYYLAERSEAVGITRPIRPFGIGMPAEAVRGLTLAFLSVRAVCNFLPQVCHLTFSTDRANYIANRLYAPMELAGLGITLLCGIFFAVVAITYIRAVRRHGGIADGIEAIAGEERLAKMNRDFRIKGHLKTLVWLPVAALLSADVSLFETSGFNILPHFIFVIILLFAVYSLSEDKRTRRALVAVGVSTAVISTVAFLLLRGFAEEYSIREIAEYTLAREAYLRVEIASVIEAVATLLFYLTVAVAMRGFIREHTGVHPSAEGYRTSEATYHKEGCRRMYFTIGIGAVSALLKCVNILLIGNPIENMTESGIIYSSRLPWLSTVILAVDLFYFLRAIWFVKDLRDEVKFKYEI